ncbi:MAG: hypothetical protein IJ005_03015 [Bacteroidales bacterium]|nr:hypothetical protein [Bacteroidales bacterium]
MEFIIMKFLIYAHFFDSAKMQFCRPVINRFTKIGKISQTNSSTSGGKIPTHHKDRMDKITQKTTDLALNCPFVQKKD